MEEQIKTMRVNSKDSIASRANMIRDRKKTNNKNNNKTKGKKENKKNKGNKWWLRVTSKEGETLMKLLWQKEQNKNLNKQKYNISNWVQILTRGGIKGKWIWQIRQGIKYKELRNEEKETMQITRDFDSNISNLI